MSNKIKSEIVLVTPDMANDFLRFNEGNRTVKPASVNYLVSCIKNGEWQTTHQGIAISETGRLLDGQHRLLAIAKADTPVMMMITRGMPESVFFAIDNGVKRNDHDLTGINKDTIQEIKFFFALMKYSPGEGLSFETNRRITPLEINKYAESIGDFCGLLRKKAPTRAKFYSSVPVRCAAIYSILAGEDIEYVIQTYRDLTLGNTLNMPPICHSLVRQVTTGKISCNGGGMTQLGNFLKVWPVFRRVNANTLKLMSRETSFVVSYVLKDLAPWFSSDHDKKSPRVKGLKENITHWLEAE